MLTLFPRLFPSIPPPSLVPQLADTCELGLARLEWLETEFPTSQASCGDLPDTVDPAPAFPPNLYTPDQLFGILMASAQAVGPSDGAVVRPAPAGHRSLFERYRALFTLRKRALDAHLSEPERTAAADLLGKCLSAPGSSLLRHEVAFVLGQLAMPSTADYLIACIKAGPPTSPKQHSSTENGSTSPSTSRSAGASVTGEHSMVRHEAAEALGAVLGEARLSEADEELAAVSRRAMACLQAGLHDPVQVVRESCVLALDIAEYVASKDQLQYADVPKLKEVLPSKATVN
ncbi:unnamed protein product [Protopolystoma xenopodis]|uniref:Deoxyhypusine monooxygenase n=1 Tax=Protopolystoma xenopodis TaxID=117903 RepID=A0A448WTK8_9PLAT|nr:unnamed protein product [Protopolystoma xenopodis]